MTIGALVAIGIHQEKESNMVQYTLDNLQTMGIIDEDNNIIR